MELANALQFSGHQDKLNLAIDLYRNVKGAHGADPTVRLRLANALVNRSVDHENGLDEALSNLSEIPDLAAKDALTGSKHWLSLAAAILTGWIHYDRSRSEDGDGKIEGLRVALSVTQHAIELWQSFDAKTRSERLFNVYADKAASNRIFYLSMLIKNGTSGEDISPSKLRDALKFEETVRVDEFIDSYKNVDNRMRAHVVLGDVDIAVDCARSVYKTLISYAEERAGGHLEFYQIGNHLIDRSERECFAAAMQVMFSNGKSWE